MTDVLDPFMPTPKLQPPAGKLRGPADADSFRVKVGRYGDRWYCDPMVSCRVALATAATWPSVSIVKGANGRDWTYVGLKRVNDAFDTDTYRNLARWPHADRYEALKAINGVGLKAAGKRGTNVHLMAEARLYGHPNPVTEDMPGYDYLAAVDQFFDQYQPTLVAAEFVCIHRDLNDVGYGGTCDAIIEIDGKRYIVDWKSRAADGEHAAYPEEAAQVAAYAGAQYIIIEGPVGPERQLVPDLDGGLIVSIKPDGCRVYPVTL